MWSKRTRSSAASCLGALAMTARQFWMIALADRGNVAHLVCDSVDEYTWHWISKAKVII